MDRMDETLKPKSKNLELLGELKNSKWRLIAQSMIAGVVAGMLVSLYRYGIEFATESAAEIYSYLKGHPVCIIPWFLVICGAAWVIYKLIKLEPYAKGSGIPQVEGIVLLGMKMRWYTILVVRFIAGLLAALLGLSVGREGPSIQIGACGAQAFANSATKNKAEKNYLITAGGAAGLAAAFNAPFSGIMFALEEVHKSFSINVLITAASAALVSDLVSGVFFGLSPVLGFLVVPQLPLRFYPWLILAGVLSGLVGSLINKFLLLSGTLYKKFPPVMGIGLALTAALPCGIFLPQVLGGGSDLIRLANSADSSLVLLAVLLAIKLLFTSISFGSGVPGGIFLPILSMGALTGGLLGGIAVKLGLPGEYIAVLVVCSMAGALTSSVKAPMTSVLLMTEMTGSLVQLMPVALVSFISLWISDMLKIAPIYEELLERIADAKNEAGNKSADEVYVEMAVEEGSTLAGALLCDVPWPDGLLAVSLHRGTQEIVPKGNTQIHTGDYIAVLSSDMNYADTRTYLSGLCKSRL